MDRNSLIAKIEAAYTKAEVRGATDDMLKATSQLLQIWETERYAHVPAALGSAASTSASYSIGQNFSYDGEGLTAGPCTCGAEDLPRPSDAVRAKALAATLDPRDEATGERSLAGINLSLASTSELHSGGYDLNGDEAV